MIVFGNHCVFKLLTYCVIIQYNVVEHETFGGNVLNNKIVVYDSQKNDRYTVKVSLNSIGDIVGYDSSKDGASKVFVYNTNYTAYHPFFYK